jgi:murein L,D-transpeptidase YafK
MKRLFFLILVIFASLLVYQYSPYSPIPDHIVIEKIIVDKSDRKLLVYADGSVIKTFTISLGDQPIGPKERDGDEKTPEGEYIILAKAGKGSSRYYKNLGVSYPSSKDEKNANRKGFKPGNGIKIHGLQNGLGFIGRFHRWKDWTDGCMAVTNEEMDDLYRHVKIGTPIVINP